MAMTSGGKTKASGLDMAFRASAGTGKTHALVSKYISELSRPADHGFAGVDRLVAITFTEKAAAEMKERLRDRLTEKIESLRSKTGIDASCANLPEDMPGWKDDQRLLSHLIRCRQSLQGAYISTIHSFCARLLRENPLGAGIDPSFTVIDETEAAALLDDCARDVILRRLRSGDAGTARLARDFGFGSAGGRGKGLKDIIVELVPLIRAADKTPAAILSGYEDYLRGLAENSTAEAAATELIALTPELMTMGKSTKLRKLAEKMSDSPITDLSRPDLAQAAWLMEEADGLKNSKDSGTDYFQTISRVRKCLAAIAAPVIERENAPHARAFIGLLDETIMAYSAAKERRSSLDYDDLQEKARDLLARDAETRRIYTSRFVRVLVDEFQDINDLQGKIISLLAPPGSGKLFVVGDVKQAIYGFRGSDVSVFGRVEDEIRAKGGGLYRLRKNFRLTPRLIDFTNGFFGALMKGDGPRGFRFNTEDDSLKPLNRPYEVESSVTRLSFKIGEGGVDEIRNLEAVTLARMIADEIGGGKIQIRGKNGAPRAAGYGDVALLLRAFGSLSVYENALRFEGVPFQVARGKGFYQTQEIRDFVSLLKLLDYSKDRLALMCALRSPFAGLSDAALLRLARTDGGPVREDIGRLLFIEGSIPSGMEKDDAEKLGRFINSFRRWRKLRAASMISELLETILSDTGYGAVMMSRFQGEQRLANIFKLIELARRYESSASTGFKTFISRLAAMEERGAREAQADTDPGGNAVRIMTVHQSKGLEFPMVIIGDIGSGRAAGAGRAAFHHEAGLGLRLFDQNSGRWLSGPMFERVKEAKEAAETEEQKRLLYVAMTRARDRLIISGSTKNGTAAWEKWVDTIIGEAGPGVEIREISAPPSAMAGPARKAVPPLVQKILHGYKPEARVLGEKPPKPPSPDVRMTVTGLATLRQCPRLYYYQSVMELPAAPAGASYSTESAPEDSSLGLGSRIHALLEKAPLGAGSPKDALARAAGEELFDLGKDIREKALADIGRAFAREPLRNLASIPAEGILREVPLAIRLSEKDIRVTLTGAADLAWFDGGKWSVVDYKYSARPEDELRYMFQLKLYAYALMTAAGMDALTLSIVYLREKDEPVSTIEILRADIAGLRREILTAARLLARLDGKPEGEWIKRDTKLCEGLRCPYRERCST